MIDETLLSTIAILASIISSVSALAYWLGKRFGSIDNSIGRLENRIERLENAFLQFSEILISTLETKNVLSSTEVLILRGVVKSLLPAPKSKYYTREVYERLLQLLDKDPNDYTMADIEEMERIADLIEMEGFESGRKDLKQYAWKLRYFAMIAKVVFVYPKLRKAQTRSTQ